MPRSMLVERPAALRAGHVLDAHILKDGMRYDNGKFALSVLSIHNGILHRNDLQQIELLMSCC